MEYSPYMYSQVNLSEGTTLPSDTHFNSYSFAYWQRALFQRACYVLDIKVDSFEGNEKDFFLYCLFRFGYVAVWNDDNLGLVFQPCTLKGYNFYYQPDSVLITNPAIKRTLDKKINTECALIKLTPDYMGIFDIINYYARRLSMIDPSIDVSIANNKTPYIAYGKTKAAVQTLKKIIDKIQSGVTAIFTDSRVTGEGDESPLEFIDRPDMKANYLTDMQLADQHTLLKAFDREIGIPTIPYEKKERMVSDEANSAIIDSQARVTIWKECLEESFKICNEMYGTNFSVDFRIKTGGNNYGPSEVDA